MYQGEQMGIRNVNTPMLTVRQVAPILNIHVNTVRHWSNQGILKAYRIGPRGDRRFRREDISRLLQEQTNRQP